MFSTFPQFLHRSVVVVMEGRGMMGKKKGDHKGEGKGEARRGKPVEFTGSCGKPTQVQQMNTLAQTGDFLKRVVELGKRKGLPCTITPEELRAANSGKR
jgi:hypothetical protein